MENEPSWPVGSTSVVAALMLLVRHSIQSFVVAFATELEELLTIGIENINPHE